MSTTKDRVWYHIPTDQLGYAVTETVFETPIFFFKDHKNDEVLNPSFCNFIDDPNDPKAFHREDFIDLGAL